jgi:hypothetical protein
MPRRTGVPIILALLLAMGGCSDGTLISSHSSEASASLRGNPITSPGQPIANNLARVVALALNDPDVRLSVRDAMRDSRFHEHKIHFRSFLEEPAGQYLLRAVATELQTAPENVYRLLHHLPDMEFYLPQKEHRIQWTGGPDYFVMAVEMPDDFKNPFVTLYRPDGKPVVWDVVNAMPEIPVFGLLPVEADFSKPDVPSREYRGEAVQSRDECHPLEDGCTSAGLWAESINLQTAISDTTGYLYRFWLPRHRDGGIGANEIEMWYYIRGTDEDPTGHGYADDFGAPCIRFTGIEPGKWYNLHLSLGDYYPKGSAVPPYGNLGTEFWEDDMYACSLWLGPGSDDWIGRTNGDNGTSWNDLYPSVAWQEVYYFVNGVKQVEGYVSFTAPVRYFLSVYISGPTSVPYGESGTWIATASNGVGPYSYQWYLDGWSAGSGQSYETTVWTNFTLGVTVTDQGTGATASSSIFVTVGDCGEIFCPQ